ncbi:MAG: YesL family protein [Eubacterium sp.]|nr:YesL family protein [Eubacterium sp.]
MTKQNIEKREGHEPGTLYREEHNREVKREAERDNLEKREGFSLRHILLDVDGPVVTFLTKTGELILLGLVWLLTSLPVLTIGTSTIALYHAIVKSVRHERGYPVREYFKAFRQHLKKGTAATLILLLWTAGLVIFNWKVAHIEVSLKSFSAKALVVMVIITLSITTYLFPIMSRFRVSLGQAFNMAFIISGQHFIVTLIHLAAMGGLVYLVIYIIPILALLALPSFWMFLSSLLMEKVLKSYMPEAPYRDGPAEDLWMYE